MFNEASIWLLLPLMSIPSLLSFSALWCLSKVGQAYSQGLVADPIWHRRFVWTAILGFATSCVLLAIVAYKMSLIASPIATSLGFIAASTNIVLGVGLLFYRAFVVPYQLRTARQRVTT